MEQLFNLVAEMPLILTPTLLGTEIKYTADARTEPTAATMAKHATGITKGALLDATPVTTSVAGLRQTSVEVVKRPPSTTRNCGLLIETQLRVPP
jgi:hypothetical protein